MSANVRQKRVSWPATAALRSMHSPLMSVLDRRGVTDVSRMSVDESVTGSPLTVMTTWYVPLVSERQ